jgi:Ca2+-binding RTX toxin-like protein
VPLATEIVIRPSESCSYDGDMLALSLTMTPASTATLVVVDGAIWFGEVNEDLLRGGAGSDSIDGGPGDDVLDAQESDDVVAAALGTTR